MFHSTLIQVLRHTATAINGVKPLEPLSTAEQEAIKCSPDLDEHFLPLFSAFSGAVFILVSTEVEFLKDKPVTCLGLWSSLLFLTSLVSIAGWLPRV
jgi:hypothetical protein